MKPTEERSAALLLCILDENGRGRGGFFVLIAELGLLADIYCKSFALLSTVRRLPDREKIAMPLFRATEKPAQAAHRCRDAAIIVDCHYCFLAPASIRPPCEGGISR